MLDVKQITEKLKAMNKNELLSLACKVLNDSGIEYTLGNGNIHFEQVSPEDAKASSFRYLVSNTAIHHAIRYSSDAAGSSLKGSIEIEYDKYDSALSCYKSGTISAA